MTERLEPKLREAALIVLRHHGVAEEELTFEKPEKKHLPPFTLMRAHRIKVHVDDGAATFEVRGTRWSGSREDFPSTGAFIAALQTELSRALA